jgi:Dolichyl-phosphate-mannose-protein mannosyltransferase
MGTGEEPVSVIRRERAWVVGLLLLHAAMVVWGLACNSVTFDENYHVPSGMLIVARGNYDVSPVNPPLVKALCGMAALAAGARVPSDSAVATENQRAVGYAFMRDNAARYHAVFTAARLPVLALSLLLGVLIWRFARRLYGPRGGMLALAFYAFSPEALAHAGIASMDVATGLGFLATIYGWWGFLRSGRRGWFALSAAGFAFTVLTRFTAWSLLPILAAVTLAWSLKGRSRFSRRAWVGLLLLVPVGLVALQAGYLGRTSFAPVSANEWRSQVFRTLAARAPGLRLPVPDLYARGFDWQAEESEGSVPTFVFRHVTTDRVWWYFPLALLVKWPLGFLVALLLRGVTWRGSRFRWRRHDLVLLLPAALFLAAGMSLVKLNAGVRYMFPLLPLLCVWLGGLAAPAAPRRKKGQGATMPVWVPRAGLALASIVAIEAFVAAPYELSSFNLFAGGPGRGDTIVNDSNVDWGQGLIALRDELKRRGIRRVNLTYHGTVDPAIYGIDYVPYGGGDLGRDSEWLAVSSYFFNGMPQRMVTFHGISTPVKVDFRSLWGTEPVARPGGCMYLFHVGRAAR